jgi:hypothetical protein
MMVGHYQQLVGWAVLIVADAFALTGCILLIDAFGGRRRSLRPGR